MLVRYRMSPKVVVTEPQQSLAGARALLDRHRIRQLPVVHRKQVLGIVTDRDLRAARADAQTVRDVMTKKPLTIAPDAPVDEAAHVLRQHKINALPVLEKSKLVGILTVTDVLQAFVELSGVGEPTYRLVITAQDGKRAESALRDVLQRTRAEVKWMRRDRQRPAMIHVRLKVRQVDDVVSAVEGAGFEVAAVVAPPAGGRR